MKLGLFGGSFDPAHLGHLLVAQAALEELQLDRLFFIPAAQSPFKPDRILAPAPRRLQLLRLSLEGQTRCEIDDREIRRGGVSYTIDTVRQYAAQFQAAELFYLIGADHVNQLPQWRESEELARHLTFVSIPRPGEAAIIFPEPFRGRALSGFPIGISASQVRQRVRLRLPIEHLVKPAVAEAILNYRLYL